MSSFKLPVSGGRQPFASADKTVDPIRKHCDRSPRGALPPLVRSTQDHDSYYCSLTPGHGTGQRPRRAISNRTRPVLPPGICRPPSMIICPFSTTPAPAPNTNRSSEESGHWPFFLLKTNKFDKFTSSRGTTLPPSFLPVIGALAVLRPYCIQVKLGRLCPLLFPGGHFTGLMRQSHRNNTPVISVGMAARVSDHFCQRIDWPGLSKEMSRCRLVLYVRVSGRKKDLI